MRKVHLTIIFCVLILITACSPSPTNRLATPSWLQGDWIVSDGITTIQISFTEDNMLFYYNNQLNLDIKSSLSLNPHVEISNQGSTNTTYQFELYNSATNGHFRITIVYTSSTDTILYTENIDGISQDLVLSRMY